MMHKHHGMLQSSGTFVARILMGLIFVLAGINKLQDTEGTAGFMGSVGLPEVTALAFLVGLFELVLGAAIILGKKTREAAVLLAVFTLIATLIFHRDLADQVQMLFFMKNFGLIAGLLYMAAYGPGSGWSLDKKGHSHDQSAAM